MRRVLVPAFCAVLAVFAAGCGNKTLKKVPVVEPLCNAPQKLNSVGICVECVADADCAVGKACNLITGTCQPVAQPVPDAGRPGQCQVGAVRCAQDGRAVQTCDAVDGGSAFENTTLCTAGQVCNPQTLTCAVCIPGETTCDSPDRTPGYQRCKDDGTGTEPHTCTDVGPTFTCHQTQDHVSPADGGVAVAALATCRLCDPGSITPSTESDGGGVGILTCDSTGSSATFTSCYPTGRYATGPDGGTATPLQCQLPVCFPGDHVCDAAANTAPSRHSCNADGTALVQDDCTGGTVCGPTPTDRGACLSPCQVAEASTSYVGCDYWGALNSNSGLDSAFTTNNQNGGSDFAFVVGNTSSSLTAHVSVASFSGGPFNATVPPNQVAIIHLPWLQICGTGQAKFGFHLVSDAPVTVYQFNPLTARRDTGNSCGFAGTCSSPYETCDSASNHCIAGAYSADASLLLPTHLLGSSYVVVAQDHESIGANGDESALPALMTVVATEDNTKVQIRSAGTSLSTAESAAPCPGGTQGSLAGISAGQTVQYSLNAGEVIQFWTKNAGTKTCTPSEQPGNTVCLWNNDFTGSIVTSVPDASGKTHKVAVFGGADCTFKPYDKFACDHVEEEMFPFSTWGKNYVGVKTHSYAGATSVYPDFWRLVSGCGAGSCPNGTTITISPPISNVRQQGICSTAGNVTTCKLPPVAANGTAPWVEFEHNSSFVATSDQPAVLAQIFVSEDEAGQGLSEGDPSLVMTPPVEQWRSSYTVLAPTTYVHNYLNLMVQTQAATGAVSVDGAVVPASEWANIPGTPFYAAMHTLSNAGNGSHVISTTGGVKVGAVVYGYDSYISYGYTGGLDLQSITNINPGG